MTIQYTAEERADIIGMLRVALVAGFVESYKDLVDAYCAAGGVEMQHLIASINPYSVSLDTEKFQDSVVNLYAKRVDPKSLFGGRTVGLSRIEDVFDPTLEGYDEVWVGSNKVLVWTTNGWFSA